MIVRGIVHCHSRLSYDSDTRLEDLRSALVRQGFQFVALTEHDRDVTEEAYESYVAACRAVSDNTFVAIPGVEVRCPRGIEIAGIGLLRLPHSGEPEDVVRQIRELGGYAVWVHPRKRRKTIGDVLDCDALEVMNGKLNGTLAPDLGLVRLVRRERSRGRTFHAIFGLDMHDELHPRSVWVECEVAGLKIQPIIESLRQGRFVNRTKWGSVASTAWIRLPDYIRLGSLRCASRAWDGLLRRLPEAPRKAVLSASRPIVRYLKLGGPLNRVE